MTTAAMAAAGRSPWLQLVRKIVCVGRNFAEHAAELGNAVPERPILFLKPPSSLIEPGQSILLPPGVDELHHEVELGVLVGRGGRDIGEAEALEHVGGYVLALDMTDRVAQSAAKAAGLPWTVAKGRDTYCPVSSSPLPPHLIDPHDVRLWCSVDGTMRQDASTRLMLFPVEKLIAYISTIMTLEEGDLILTGTPSGVGPVRAGQTIYAGLGDHLTDFAFPVRRR